MFRSVLARSCVIAAACLALTACSNSALFPGSTTDGKLKVVAAFYPLQYAASVVGGDQVDITTLTTPGVEPHDLELTALQVAAISQADVVIYIPGFQPAVDEAVANEAPTRALDASAGISLLPASAGDAGIGGQSTSATDPHIWLNPLNMRTIGSSIASRLVSLRPSAATAFTSNLDRLTSSMSALDHRWSVGTATCANRDLVVSHEAFAYLAQRYRFVQRGISGLSPDSEPSPSTVAAVADFVRNNHVRTIYYETLVDPKIATVVAQETGARTAVLDPLEGIAPGSTATYVTVMDANLASVIAGQPCS